MNEFPDPDRKSRYNATNQTILKASLYLAAFAVLENAVIDAVELFYGEKDTTSSQWKKYVEEVLTYSDDTYESSSVWLLKKGVIQNEHHRALMICKRRNDSIARGFSNILFQDVFDGDDAFEASQTPKVQIEKDEFEVMIDLMHRVEAWRTRNEYGLMEPNDDDDLESILPVSVIGMMRIASLAFPENLG
jgi:hypothetical protein